MEKKEKVLVLIDGNALVHRGFHALPPTFRTKDGELVNGVFGFISVLLKVFEEIKPQYVACTFDIDKKTFRHEEYKEYKGTRVSAPQELYDQFPRVREVVKAFNIPIYEKEGFEADDVIGTICHIEETDKRIDRIIVVTGDLDTLQLVTKKTKVLTLKKGVSETILYDEKGVRDRFELEVSQFIDFKGLRGDPSDNIPGVPGVGEKTAKKLLVKYKSLEKVYEALSAHKEEVERFIGKRIAGLLEENKKQAFLSKDLATIRQNVQINFDLNKAILKEYDEEEVKNLFKGLGFRSLMNRLPESKMKKGEKKEEIGCETLDQADSHNFFETISKEKNMSIEIHEGCGDEDCLTGVILGFREKNIYLPWSDFKSDEKLLSLLKNDRVAKVGHGLKRIIKIFLREGVIIQGVSFDTKIAAYLIDSSRTNYELPALSFSETGIELHSLKEIKKLEKKNEIDEKRLREYFCKRVFIIFKLWEIFEKGLQDDRMLKLFWEIEMPLVEILAGIERNGIKLDVDFLKKLRIRMGGEISELRETICGLAGEEFNVNSTVQLREVLYEKLKIDTSDIKKTKTGYSTAATELEKLIGKHEIIDHLFEYRELSKLMNTYVTALPKLVDEKNRLHTTFKQTGTTTGRLSSENPNLQNIPVRTETGREIRKAFVSDRGFKLVSLDYSQIELRIVASLSKDEEMLKVFSQGGDIHAATAALVRGIPTDEVTSEMRRSAKSLNFGVIYGMGPYGFSRDAGITREEAREFIDRYMEKFSGLANWIKGIKEKAQEDGYVETLTGRRRYLPEINSSNWQIRSAAERMAINAPNQGLAADIIKMAMIKCWELTSKDIKMLLQVHDELVFEIRDDKVESFVVRAKEVMEGVYKLDVPLIVDAKVGDNWKDLKTVKF